MGSSANHCLSITGTPNLILHFNTDCLNGGWKKGTACIPETKSLVSLSCQFFQAFIIPRGIPGVFLAHTQQVSVLWSILMFTLDYILLVHISDFFLMYFTPLSFWNPINQVTLLCTSGSSTFLLLCILRITGVGFFFFWSGSSSFSSLSVSSWNLLVASSTVSFIEAWHQALK